MSEKAHALGVSACTCSLATTSPTTSQPRHQPFKLPNLKFLYHLPGNAAGMEQRLRSAPVLQDNRGSSCSCMLSYRLWLFHVYKTPRQPDWCVDSFYVREIHNVGLSSVTMELQNILNCGRDPQTSLQSNPWPCPGQHQQSHPVHESSVQTLNCGI